MRRLLRLAVALLGLVAPLLSCGPLHAQTPVPTLIQSWASSTNLVCCATNGGEVFTIPLINPVISGDALVLAITYPNGSAPSGVSDSVNGSWGAAVQLGDAGASNTVAGIWAFCDAAAGATTITVTFGAEIIPFQYTWMEWNNIATSSCTNGSTARTAQTGPALNAASFTPGNNNTNGGNLILEYSGSSNVTASGNPTSWVAGSGYTLVEADISWTNNQGFPHATESTLQTVSTGITPAITATGDAADTFNSVAVAFKVASAGGTPAAGIRVNRIARQSSAGPPVSWNLQFPCAGNLIVLKTSQDGFNITSITDTNTNTWTQRIASGGGSPQIWDTGNGNTVCSPTETVTIHSTLYGNGATVGFYDVSGAANRPFDQAAHVGPTSFGSGTATGCTSTLTETDSNIITPTTTNGLVIAVLQLGQGPGCSVSAPSGGIWNMVTYTQETDTEQMENADGAAIFYNATTAAETWSWVVTNAQTAGADNYSSSYVSYRMQPTPICPVPCGPTANPDTGHPLDPQQRNRRPGDDQ